MYHYSPLFMHSPFTGSIGLLVVIALLWEIAWKGWALWLAARRGEKAWFIILLIVNTVGILEIIYIFFVAKQKDTKMMHDAHHKHDHEAKSE